MIKAGSSYFFSNKSIKMDLKTLKKIKYLKSKRVVSYYIDTVMLWENTTNEISLIMNVFARLCKLPNDFIKRHHIKPFHISLIRRMYFEYDNNDTYLNFKRPYGNSNVIGDVAEEYIDYKKIDIYDEDGSDIWYENNELILLNIHNRVMNIFDLMLKELMIDSTEYKRTHLNKWISTKNGIAEIMSIDRKLKLKRIIE